MCGDNQETGQDVWWDSVGGDKAGVVGSIGGCGAADGGLASIGSEDDDGADAGFEGACEISEGLYVKHVDLWKRLAMVPFDAMERSVADLVNEEHPWHQLCDALIDVLVDDLVDLPS